MSKVKYISLGGYGNVTQNMHAFETEKDIIIIDAGIGFPDSEQLGVDVVIPDTTYLKKRKHKIRALVISHAHEDHIGGVPYVIDDLGNPPIYATRLARAFLQNKLAEHKKLKGQKIITIQPDTASLNFGDFEIVPYHVNHSIPEAQGFFIRTPAGNIVYSPDYKFDWTPIDGQLFEVGKLARLATEGVLALFSDCLGATREGFTKSERSIQDVFENIMADATGQVFITTMSSNISRMQLAINASMKFGRKVVPVGRSIVQNLDIARNLGYIKAPDATFLELHEARRYKPSKLTYIIAGSFGQEGSALDRLSRGENRSIKLKKNAVVIFSADPIPGVHVQVGAMIDRLISQDVKVVYSEIQDNLHVSGHGIQGDMALMIGLTQPKYFVPIGGEVRHQHAYRELVSNMGFDPNNVFELKSGETVEFAKNSAKLGDKVEVKDVFVHGKLVGDVGQTILSERSQLAEEGVVVIALRKEGERLSDKVVVESRGFVYRSSHDEITKEVVSKVKKIIKGRKISSWKEVKEDVEKRISGLIYTRIKRRPMVVVVLVN